MPICPLPMSELHSRTEDLLKLRHGDREYTEFERQEAAEEAAAKMHTESAAKAP